MSKDKDDMDWVLNWKLDWDKYRDLLLNAIPSLLFEFYDWCLKLAVEHPDDIELLKSIREAILGSKEVTVKIIELLEKNTKMFREILAKVKEEDIHEKV